MNFDEEVRRFIGKLADEYAMRVESIASVFSPRVLHHLETQREPDKRTLIRGILCTAYRKQLAIVEVQINGMVYSVDHKILAPELISNGDD